MVLLQIDRVTLSDGGVFLQRDRAMESTSRQPVVDCFATILTAAQNFWATIWPFNDIVRSLVVFISEVAWKKDYLRKTACVWLCGYDAAFVKLL